MMGSDSKRNQEKDPICVKSSVFHAFEKSCR